MLSPMPDIGEMARQPAGHEEDRIDADVVAFPGLARRQPRGRDRNAPQPVLVEGHRQPFLAGAGLDFDKGQSLSAAGDEVDLATGHARPLGKDPPTAQPQPPGRQPLRAPAAPLGLGPPVQRLSSRARA